MAASDYVKAMPDSIDRWMPRRITSLGTDGFGRSEGRAALRDFFEVDAKSIVAGDARAIWRATARSRRRWSQKAIEDLGINPEKPNPATSWQGPSWMTISDEDRG